MLANIIQEWKFFSISHIQFSQVPWDILSCRKEIIKFVVLLLVLHIRLKSFSLYLFFKFWPFISALNIQCLEI